MLLREEASDIGLPGEVNDRADGTVGGGSSGGVGGFGAVHISMIGGMTPETRNNVKDAAYYLERDRQKRFALATQRQREARIQSALLRRQPVTISEPILPPRCRARRPTLRKSLKALTVQLFLYERPLEQPLAQPEFLSVTIPLGRRCLLALSQEGALMITRKDCSVTLISSTGRDEYSVLDCVYEAERGFVVIDVLVWQGSNMLHHPAEQRLAFAQELALQGCSTCGVRLLPAQICPAAEYKDQGKGVLFYHRQGVYQMAIARTVFKWKHPDLRKRLREFVVLRVVHKTELETYEGKSVGKVDSGEPLGSNLLVKYSVKDGTAQFLGRAPGFARPDTLAKYVLHFALNQQLEQLQPDASAVLMPAFDLDSWPEEQAEELEKLSAFQRNLPYIHMTHQDSAVAE